MEEQKIQLDIESGPEVSTRAPGHFPLEAPPAYGGQVQTSPPKYSNDNPPTYDSVFGKVRKVRDESDGNVDYAWKIFAMICCGTICTVTQIILCLAIPVASIVIGAMHLDDCTIEKYIPIYLIVAGVFGIVKGINSAIFAVINHKKKQDQDDDEDNKKQKPNPIDSLLNCFLFAWFIAGSVWVYRIHDQVTYEDPLAGTYCDKTTYLFTFWIITVGYIMAALSLLCCCGICAVMICVAVGSAASE